VSSDVRLARFLLWMSQRMAEMGQSPRRLLLRMGRRDIASLLCVAHETVSRGFTNLTEGGYVLTQRKEVELLDIIRLHDFSLFTRGTATEVAAHRGRDERLVHRASMAWLADLGTGLGSPSEACTDRRQVVTADSLHAVAHHGIRALT